MRKKILPVLLTLAMVLGMLPLSVFAADVTVDANGVAAVSDADGLKSALTTQGATTIQLSGDITVAEALTITRGVTIDLNGHTLTSSVQNPSSGNTYAVAVSATDKVTIKNGTLSAAACAGIQSTADTTTNIELNGLAMTAKKWAVVNRAKGTMTITGCTVNSTDGYAVENASGSTLTASDSTFTGASWLVLNRSNGTMTLTNCTVTVSANGGVENNGGTVTINGGQYGANGATIVNHTGGTMNIGGAVEVTSAGAAQAVENDGAMTISGGKFKTTGGTTSIPVILCGSDSVQNKTAPSLTVTNATVNSTNGIGITSANGGKVIVGDGAQITAKGNALGGNNTKPSQNFTVQEGAVLTSSDDAAIYQAATGELTITGGTITGKAGVVDRAGTVNVTGGTIIAYGTAPFQVGDRTDPVPASGIVYDLKANYTGSSNTDSKVTVSTGATIQAGTDQEAVTLLTTAEDTTVPTAKLEVTGGAFYTAVDSKYLADSVKYQAVDEDGKYSYHANVTDAQAAAGETGTVSVPTENGEWVEIVTGQAPLVKFTQTTTSSSTDDKQTYYGGKLEIKNPNSETKTYLVAFGGGSRLSNGKYLSLTYRIQIGAGLSHTMPCQSVLNVKIYEISPTLDLTSSPDIGSPIVDKLATACNDTF